MSERVIFAACVAIVVLIAGMGFCANIGIVPKQPQGFRFGNGRLLAWGASKDELIAMLPPQPGSADEVKIDQDEYTRCMANQQKTAQLVQQAAAAGLPWQPHVVPVCDATVHLHRLVWCSNQQPPAPDHPLSPSAEAKGMIGIAAGGDGCVVSARALPVPYYALAHIDDRSAILKFNRDRFFEIDVQFASTDFGDIERSLSESLGKPIKRVVGTAQNGFGAFFDTVDDTWGVGPVLVSLRKRVVNVNKGVLLLMYIPLLDKNALKRPAAPPPF